ncbi:MAG: ComF family protein [Acidobacteria bacterium]|nr:ComF family protein [Acidobacteriota bacterium]
MQPEHFCIQCRTAFLNPRPLNEAGLCRLCAAGVTNFEGAYSCGGYDGAMRDLIHLYKYRRVRPLAAHFGKLMARAYPRDQVVDALVPVPMHWRKRLRRGFDQTRALARELSRRTGIPVLRALKKKRHTEAQAGLSRAKRRMNVTGVFQARASVEVRGLHVLLIDDVFTTGATINAAAAALKRAGAARVSVLTLARADRLSDKPAVATAAEVHSLPGASR